MIDYSELLKKKNREVEESYLKNLEKIRKIKEETQNSEDKFLKFAFHHGGNGDLGFINIQFTAFIPEHQKIKKKNNKS